jgi:hypothetical protein
VVELLVFEVPDGVKDDWKLRARGRVGDVQVPRYGEIQAAFEDDLLNPVALPFDRTGHHGVQRSPLRQGIEAKAAHELAPTSGFVGLHLFARCRDRPVGGGFGLVQQEGTDHAAPVPLQDFVVLHGCFKYGPGLEHRACGSW